MDGEGWTGLERLDHLVYAAPRLDVGVARIRERLGVEAIPGGRHPRWGTRNALVGLGGTSYLELIAPDPRSEAPDGGRPFDLDGLGAPRLATWALRCPDLEGFRTRAGDAGLDPGPVLEGSREREDGSLLRWRLTDPSASRAGGVVPFLIDWGDSPHPASRLDHPVTVAFLRGEHPAPETVGPVLEALEVDLPLRRGAEPALGAVLRGPAGRIELR